MTWKDAAGAIGKTLLVFGMPPLIFSLFGALVLLLGIYGYGFWEVATFPRFCTLFFVWGAPLVTAGIALLVFSYQDKQGAP
jgi:hypothetical protein